MDKELEFLVGVYGRSQIEMIAIGLLNGDGSPKPTKNMSTHEKDAIAIYDNLSFKMKGIGKDRLNRLGQYSNEVAKKLINEDTLINNYLLSMMLYRLYLQEISGKFERDKILPKVKRQIAVFEALEGQEYAKIRRVTNRVADNMFRVFVGKAQLSDEIRDIIANKFKRRIDEKSTNN